VYTYIDTFWWTWICTWNIFWRCHVFFFFTLCKQLYELFLVKRLF